LLRVVQIVERGTHQQLLQVRGIYHNLVARQHYMAEDDNNNKKPGGLQQNGNGNGNGNGVHTPVPSRPSGGTRVVFLDPAGVRRTAGLGLV
jgi:hypothetical protein